MDPLAYKEIEAVLQKESGFASETDFVEQVSWLLFLKYLDQAERTSAQDASTKGQAYESIVAPGYQWGTWAAPIRDGKIDERRALAGERLRAFVDDQLFPYLRGFTNRAAGPDTIEYDIGETFSRIDNKFQSGDNLREVIDIIERSESPRRSREAKST